MSISIISLKTFVIAVVLLSFVSSCSKRQGAVLLFTKTEGFRHQSIEESIPLVADLLRGKNLKVRVSEDASIFNDDSLALFEAVIFLNTTGDVLNDAQQEAFQQFIRRGGGFVGIHAATDTEFDWPWYNGLVGAYFDGHPKIQDATMHCVDASHPLCSSQSSYTINEEWYNFKSISPTINVIMTLDESSYAGGTNGKYHPIVWQHHYDGGRSFYTGIGHKIETYRDSLFIEQLTAGIDFVMGNQ